MNNFFKTSCMASIFFSWCVCLVGCGVADPSEGQIVSQNAVVASSRETVPIQSLELQNSRWEEIIKLFGGVYKNIDEKNEGIVDPANVFTWKGSNYDSYRQKKYIDSIDENIFSVVAIKVGSNKRTDYWSRYSPSLRSEFVEDYKRAIGYSESLGARYEINNNGQLLIEDPNYILEKIEFKNRYGQISFFLKATPRKNIRGVIVMMHGRNSGPDNLFGIPLDDYSSGAAKKWVTRGYIVYAPLVHTVQGPNPNILGISSLGLDISNVEDVLEYAITVDGQTDIIAWGLSYGADVAEGLGAISSSITCVVSSGGSARGDIIQRAEQSIRLVGKSPSEHWAPERELLYGGANRYKLIFPKPLIISIGIKDQHNSKLESLVEISDFYRRWGGDQLRINIHSGAHIPDNDGEMLLADEVCSKKS